MNNTNEFSDVATLEARSNPVLGVLGAIGGALLGAVLWVILYQFGFIAYIAGIAIVFCSCSGYALLSKSSKLGGVIISICISVVVLLVAVFFCWGLDIYNEMVAEYEITLIQAILVVPEVAFTEDFIFEFIKEIFIGLMLIAIGCAPFVRKAIHNKKQAEKM